MPLVVDEARQHEPHGPRAGFSLALACDFRVLDEAATFRQAYTSAGLSIDGGATFMLPRLAGLARALV